MISPRGLILPQLPMGGASVKMKKYKKRAQSKEFIKALYEITNTETGEKVFFDSIEGSKYMGVSRHRVSSASGDGGLVAGKFRVKKTKEQLKKYNLVNTKTGVKSIMTVNDICEFLDRTTGSVYNAIANKKVIAKKYMIEPIE